MEWIVMLIKALAGTAGSLLALWGGYYLVSGLMCWRGQRPFPVRPARTKFAVLIAARNEELVIGPLINSLLMQDYPPELYDIWVIPNNCTDHTARAAAGFGARVLKCDRPVKSKGEVLRFAYARLRGRRYDACCVFDADNVVDSRFLREMDLAYQAGAGAAQGYRDSKNPYDNPLSGCYSIYYWMMDRFYNQSRAAMGLSAMINGTGFMVAARVLEGLGGWNTHTLSEDLEMTVQCALAGERVVWVPRAVTYDEQPLDYAVSVTQRRRWTSGTIQVAGRYLSRLGRGVEQGSSPLALTDLAALLVTPFYQAAALGGLILSSVSAALACPREELALWALLTAALTQLAGMILGSAAAAALVLTLEGKWDRRLLPALGLYGLFLLSWLPITLGCLVKQTTQWEEIRHTRNVSPQPAANRDSLAS